MLTTVGTGQTKTAAAVAKKLLFVIRAQKLTLLLLLFY